MFHHFQSILRFLQIRLSSETKAILSQDPNTRTPEQVQTVRGILSRRQKGVLYQRTLC